MEQEIKKALFFWNDLYKNLEVEKINRKDLELPEGMKDIFLKFISSCHKIIDFGCGEGVLMMLISNAKKNNELIGIENGENIVNFTSKLLNENDFKDIKIIDGGIDALDNFENDSIDGFILSNVIDVLPKEIALCIEEKIYQKIRKGGYLFLKVNAYFSKEEYLSRGFINFKENLYSKNGVLRSRQLSDEDIIDYFSTYYELIDKCQIEWQAKNFFDRIFLLEKK